MVFERSWKKEELEAGRCMICHPVSGVPMEKLRRSEGRLYLPAHQGGWDDDPKQLWQAAVSEDKDVQAEEPFPAHWKWDPYTGKRLRSDNNIFQAFYENPSIADCEDL